MLRDHNPEGAKTVNFLYDDNGRMIRATLKSNQVTTREDYTYGNGNKPLSAVWTGQADESGTAMVQYTYTKNTCVEAVVPEEGKAYSNVYTFDDKGNLVSEEVFIGLDWMYTKGIYGDFDDKHSAQSHQPWHWKWNKINNNRSYFLSGKDITMSHAIEYTYNDAGYPIKADVYEKQSGGLVESRTFIYKKTK